MPNQIQWSALGTYTTIIAGAAVAPTLKSLAAAGQKLGGTVAGATERFQYGDFDLLCKYATAPAAGAHCQLYVIQSVNGTIYQDGDDTVAPPATAYVGSFPMRLVATAQRVSLRGILLPATDWKPLLINKGSTAFSAVNDENVLSYRPYNTEIL